jgi:hypothetical protein
LFKDSPAHGVVQPPQFADRVRPLLRIVEAVINLSQPFVLFDYQRGAELVVFAPDACEPPPVSIEALGNSKSFEQSSSHSIIRSGFLGKRSNRSRPVNIPFVPRMLKGFAPRMSKFGPHRLKAG